MLCIYQSLLYREETHIGSDLAHKSVSSFKRIFYLPVENSILHNFLELTDGIAWFDGENLHHIITCYRILEIADSILFLHFHQLLLHKFEVGMQSCHLAGIL